MKNDSPTAVLNFFFNDWYGPGRGHSTLLIGDVAIYFAPKSYVIGARVLDGDAYFIDRPSKMASLAVDDTLDIKPIKYVPRRDIQGYVLDMIAKELNIDTKGISMTNETYKLNFFFRDYVTDDIMGYGCGEVFIYHYKETIFGVRDLRKKTSVFVDIATIPAVAQHFAPTLEQLTEAHIKEAYEENDHTNETTSRVPMNEIALIAKEAVCNEMARVFDEAVGVEAE